MPAHPVLPLPAPSLVKPATKQRGFSPRSPVPPEVQDERIPAQFAELQKALAERRLELGENADGIDPGAVLVLETNCPVEEFQRAVQAISGLEWLAEELGDDIEDDAEDAEQESAQTPAQGDLFAPRLVLAEPEPEAQGHLYLAFTNQKALTQLEHLWNLYSKDRSRRLDDGLGPLKQIFKHLLNIRPWGVEDRLREAELTRDWEERIQRGAELVPVEIEIWYRTSRIERERREKIVRQLVHAEGGTIVSQVEIEGIRYHALLARLTAASAQRILAHDYTHLIRSDEIMFFRAVGQISAPAPATEDVSDIAQHPPRSIAPSPGQPRVALLDGLPLGNHTHLAGRLVIDDPDGWDEDYLARQRRHGTAMASIILHGELDASEEPLPSRLYVRPIMRPCPEAQGQERVPQESLVVDLVYRALRRMFEGEGEGDTKQPPSAPDVVIVNLSIGDQHRPFLGRMLSPWARLLDWAAWHYKILFCVSAGNHCGDLELRMPGSVFRGLPHSDRERIVLQALREQKRSRSLLSPAEAINVLTVGAAHADCAPPRPDERRLDVVTAPSSVSPISAQGPGFRRSVKPDVLFPGGRVLFDDYKIFGPAASLCVSNYTGRPGHQVAVPGTHDGELTRTAYERGSSCAAALASRAAARCLSVLEGILPPWGTDGLSREHQPALLKAMLVHGAAWHQDARSVISASFGDLPTTTSADEQRAMTHFYGYGAADPRRVVECEDHRVTLLGWGQLSNQEVFEYRLPLPDCISGQQLRHRLIVTLAWITPLNFAHRRYRGARMWFEFPKANGQGAHPLADKRREVHHQTVRRGTVQHEIFEGPKVDLFDGDSQLVIHVHCREDAGGFSGEVAYGLCVTLEVDDADLPVYEQIRARIGIPVPVHI